jgi:hypothetical protein
VPAHMLKAKKKSSKTQKAYNGYLEKANPRAHEFMSRAGVHESLKAKFLEFFEVNDVRGDNCLIEKELGPN